MPKIVPIVFVSSTFRDLREHREVAQHVLEAHGLPWHAMENFGARADTPERAIREMLESCDLFVGILGHMYGTLVPGHRISFTEFEYRLATDLGKDLLMFVADDEVRVAPSMVEPDRDKRDHLHRLKEDVKARHAYERFTEESLRSNLERSVGNWLKQWEMRAQEMLLCCRALRAHEKDWIAQLYSTNSSEVETAIIALEENRAGLEHFYALLRLGRKTAHAQIFTALWSSSHFDDRIADILSETLGASDPDIRALAVQATANRTVKRERVPEGVVPLVLRLEYDADERVRYEVAHALWTERSDERSPGGRTSCDGRLRGPCRRWSCLHQTLHAGEVGDVHAA